MSARDRTDILRLQEECLRLRAERDTLTAEIEVAHDLFVAVSKRADMAEAELCSLRAALVKWKHDPDWFTNHRRHADLMDLVPDDNWGLAPREEGKQ